jgi:hypothetical protein
MKPLAQYPTPETDQFAERIGDMPHGMTNPRYRLCRDLERRNAALRDALEGLVNTCDNCPPLDLIQGISECCKIARETLTLTAPKR